MKGRPRSNRATDHVLIRVHGLRLLPPSARKPRALAAVCRRVIAAESSSARGELNVVFLDREKMRRLNRKYLDRDRDTDVIAFDYSEDPGPMPGEHPLGDIFISAHLARVQAEQFGHPVLTEALVLAAHGMLHVLGYDDSTAAERARMRRKQEAAVGSAVL